MVHLQRIAIATALIAFVFGGYFWIGLTTDPAGAASLATPLDARIPFLPASIVVYVAVYLMILLPVFLIESPALFGRVVQAYAFVAGWCLLCFWLFPVSGAELRPDLDTVATHPFLLWGLRLSYGLDPPVNLFPSLHLGGATIAALSVGVARRRDGVVACAAIVPVAISVCTVKQHFWVDAAAGIALGIASWALFLARWTPPDRVPLARGPRAWWGFGALVAGVYAAFYVAYRIGLEPWPGASPG